MGFKDDGMTHKLDALEVFSLHFAGVFRTVVSFLNGEITEYVSLWKSGKILYRGAPDKYLISAILKANGFEGASAVFEKPMVSRISVEGHYKKYFDIHGEAYPFTEENQTDIDWAMSMLEDLGLVEIKSEAK